MARGNFVGYAIAKKLGKMDFRLITAADAPEHQDYYEVRILNDIRKSESFPEVECPAKAFSIYGESAVVDWNKGTCVVNYATVFGFEGTRTETKWDYTFKFKSEKKYMEDGTGTTVFENYNLYEVEEMGLQETYAEWREVSESMLADGHNGSVDCGEISVRQDFSNFAELKETISFDEMLSLEQNYTPGK